MPKPTIPAQTTTHKREILDVDGTPLASTANIERAGPDDAGGVQREKTYVSIVTVDGIVYHSGMDIPLAVCTSCRRGLKARWFREAEAPTHGICTQANAVRCSREGCGAWCCPRHARRVDGQWVCRDCAAGSAWWRALRDVVYPRAEG